MFKNDETLKYKLLNLLMDDPSYILLLKNKYIDIDLWKFCIEREPNLFRHMKDPSIEMCEFALEMDGYNLKHIVKNLPNIVVTKKMAFIALKNCPKAIFYVPRDIIDVGLMEIAFDSDPSLMKSFNYNELRSSYVLSRIKENPSCIKYINNPTNDLIIEAIKADKNVCVYFDKISPEVKKVIEELYPELSIMFTV